MDKQAKAIPADYGTKEKAPDVIRIAVHARDVQEISGGLYELTLHARPLKPNELDLLQGLFPT